MLKFITLPEKNDNTKIQEVLNETTPGKQTKLFLSLKANERNQLFEYIATKSGDKPFKTPFKGSRAPSDFCSELSNAYHKWLIRHLEAAYNDREAHEDSLVVDACKNHFQYGYITRLPLEQTRRKMNEARPEQPASSDPIDKNNVKQYCNQNGRHGRLSNGK